MTFLFCCFSTICTNKYARDGLFIILMYGSNTQNVEFTGGSRRSKSLFYKSIVFIITLWLALTENIYADSRCLNKTLSLGKFISLRWKSWSFEKSGINFYLTRPSISVQELVDKCCGPMPPLMTAIYKVSPIHFVNYDYICKKNLQG